jgi:very-short-patch-repair endonuclease
MPDHEKTHRFPPLLLARARELRRQMTHQERKLWSRLRGRQLYGRKFRRQHPLHRFVLDFHVLVQEQFGLDMAALHPGMLPESKVIP